MIFQESYGHIYILTNGDIQFESTAEEFVRYESTYQVLTGKDIVRRWTDSVQYVSDGNNQTHDTFYTYELFEKYCTNVEEYKSLYVIDHPLIDDTPPPSVVLPKIYMILEFTKGDGKIPPGIDRRNANTSYLQIDGWIGFNPLDVSTKLPIPYSWRITICKVRSELNPTVIDSFVRDVNIVNGEVHILDFTVETSGIYMISDEDFDDIEGSMFGLPTNYEVVLYGGAKFFKVVE